MARFDGLIAAMFLKESLKVKTLVIRTKSNLKPNVVKHVTWADSHIILGNQVMANAARAKPYTILNNRSVSTSGLDVIKAVGPRIKLDLGRCNSGLACGNRPGNDRVSFAIWFT